MILRNKFFIFAFSLAFFFRIILMPISAHSDLLAINMFPPLLINNRIIDIYSYLNGLEKNIFYYTPMTYFTIGISQIVYPVFSDNYINWVSQLREMYVGGFQGQAADYLINSSNYNLHINLFLSKSPYLLFEILTIFFLLSFFKKKLITRGFIYLWLFNPILIYSTYIFGQLDIIPVFFTLAGFYYLNKKKYLGIFFLGVAAAYKLYAFLFILPVALIYGENIKSKSKLLIISITPFLLTLMPSLLVNPKIAFEGVFMQTLNLYSGEIPIWAYYSST